MSARSRLARGVVAATASAGLLLGLGACQYQTLQEYTPADGVNSTQQTAKLRNLTVLVTGPGEGVLSGTIYSDVTDRLTSVTGVALQPNGSAGPALQGSMVAPRDIPAKQAVVLTDGDPIRITGDGLTPGLLARIQYTFTGAGVIEVEVPVLDKNSPEYRDLQIGPTTVPA